MQLKPVCDISRTEAELRLSLTEVVPMGESIGSLHKCVWYPYCF